MRQNIGITRKKVLMAINEEGCQPIRTKLSCLPPNEVHMTCTLWSLETIVGTRSAMATHIR